MAQVIDEGRAIELAGNRWMQEKSLQGRGQKDSVRLLGVEKWLASQLVPSAHEPLPPSIPDDQSERPSQPAEDFWS